MARPQELPARHWPLVKIVNCPAAPGKATTAWSAYHRIEMERRSRVSLYRPAVVSS